MANGSAFNVLTPIGCRLGIVKIEFNELRMGRST